GRPLRPARSSGPAQGRPLRAAPMRGPYARPLRAAWLIADPVTKMCGTKGRTDMNISKNGTRVSSPGSPEYFTGPVRVDALFETGAPARAAGANVTFEPGARTAWHTHPLGQTLVITAGSGRVQSWGGPVQEVTEGDVVSF